MRLFVQLNVPVSHVVVVPVTAIDLSVFKVFICSTSPKFKMALLVEHGDLRAPAGYEAQTGKTMR